MVDLKLSTLSRGFRKIGGKLRMGSSSLSTTSEVDSTPSSPSMTFSEDGLDDSDNEEANYDQVTLGC